MLSETFQCFLSRRNFNSTNSIKHLEVKLAQNHLHFFEEPSGTIDSSGLVLARHMYEKIQNTMGIA